MCHILLQDPKFFSMLLRLDLELARQLKAQGCRCGGILHSANYPRKPRSCPIEVRADYEWRFSFCCDLCRKRSTAVSVRFLGRRVYLSLAVVLLSAGRGGATATTARLCESLTIPVRTMRRWATWWSETFPSTPLWQTQCARFMPPLASEHFPVGLIARFTGSAAESMIRLLVFLTPLTVRQ